MSLYVYCLSDELEAATVEELTGVGGAAVRVLSLGRIAAVVSEFEDESVAVTSENVRAHNRVNSQVLAALTPLPFRFGTRLAESRLAEYVAANEESLVASLARVRGCVEMSVKIRDGASKAKGKRQKAEEESDEAAGESEGTASARVGGDDAASAAGEDAFEGSARGGAVSEGSARVGTGTAFLLAKRREILGDEASRLGAEEVAAWLAAGVAGAVRDSDVRVRPSESLVVRAAHLVERARVEEYRERVRSLSEERRSLQFLTSGPWPPYSFSDIERR